jgi:sec-independent protein translocase protein TatC
MAELTHHSEPAENSDKPAQPGAIAEEQFDAQSLTDHLRELRSCLVISLIAVAAGFAGSYGFIKPIGAWFFKPLTSVLPEGSSLIFTSYQEGFFFI